MEKQPGRYVDLHMHSTASDGTDSPREIVTAVQQAGIKVFAVTDHDTIDGAVEASACIPEGMEFYPGIEFSCRSELGKCHILGFCCDTENKAFQDALTEGREIRRKKLDQRLCFLREEKGVILSEEQKAYLYRLNSAGKPHIARILVDLHLARTIQEAIDNYLRMPKVPGEKDRISAKTAVSAILASGGVPVWAHPLGGEGETHLEAQRFETMLSNLISLGIQGLECYYSRYNEEEESFLLKAAKQNHLFVSGGSDYHGTAKNIPLVTLNNAGIPVTEDQLTVLELLRERNR